MRRTRSWNVTTVARIHAEKERSGNTYRGFWSANGGQRSFTFENLPSAERLKTLLQDHGPAKRCASSSDEIGRRVPTVTEWLYTRIDNLTGVQPATIQRYRTYVSRVV